MIQEKQQILGVVQYLITHLLPEKERKKIKSESYKFLGNF